MPLRPSSARATHVSHPHERQESLVLGIGDREELLLEVRKARLLLLREIFVEALPESVDPSTIAGPSRNLKTVSMK